MKKIVLLAFITAVVSSLNAQTQNADSLKQQLNLTNSDTARLNTLARLGYYYQDSKPDSLMYYAKQLLELAQHVNNARMISVAYSLIGEYEYVVGNYSLSLQWLFKSLQVAEDINDSSRIASTHNLIGNTYKEYGDYDKAIANYIICKDIAELIHDTKQNDLFGNLNLGEVYALKGIADSALPYAQQAYALAVKYHSRFIGSTLISLGYVHMLLNEKALSAEYFREGMESYKKNFGNSRGLSKGTLFYASLFEKYQQPDSAVYFAHVALNVAKEVPYLKGIGTSARFLASMYDSLHQTDSALFYLKLFIATNDSINDRAKIASFENEAFLEQVRENERAQALQKAEHERGQNIQYALIALGIIVFISIFLLLSRSIIVNEKWIEFLGVLGLLVVFEFINLFIHPYISEATHDSPIFMLIVLVAIAALLIPLHHKLEKWITEKMVEKNKRVRLSAAKKTIEKLENG